MNLPPELLAAYEQDPTDFALVLALADAAIENGDEQLGDCLKWVAAKERWPRVVEDWNGTSTYGRGGFG